MPTGTNKLGNNGGRAYSFLNRPVTIDCNFIVDSSNGNGLGIRSLKGAGVRNVFMHTSATPGAGAGGFLNPNPPSGFALIQLHNNYNRYCGGFSGFVSPTTGGTIAINSTSLTTNNPYIIASVGHGSAGTATIATVADSSGSLASKYFTLYDGYGNTYQIWFSVSGVGSAPIGVSGTLVQQSISTNDTAATIGADLVVTIENLLAAQPGNLTAPSGVYSFTATGTTTVTVVSTVNSPLPGGPADGAGSLTTGFTFATTKDQTNQQNWNAVGLQTGVVPNVGAAFVATATGYSSRGGSTGLVIAPGVSGIMSLEVVGDPNQTLAPIPLGGSPNVGGWIMVQMLAPVDTLPVTSGTAGNAVTLNTATTLEATGGGTVAITTTMTPTAPTNGSVCGMTFNVEAASVIIAGE
jgi:hypothetical protein